MTHKEMTEKIAALTKQLELMDRVIKSLEARVATLEFAGWKTTPTPFSPPPVYHKPIWWTQQPTCNPQDAFQ